MPVADPDEALALVNENDEPIGQATRAEVHEEALLHRAVHALLVDEGGRVILQRRSRDKRTYPGLLTSSASGHVAPGEAPEQAAARELAEEIGVDAELEAAGTVRVEDLDVGEREVVHVFVGTWEGPVDPDEREVMEVVHAPIDSVRAWTDKDPGRLADSFVPVFESVEAKLRALAEAA